MKPVLMIHDVYDDIFKLPLADYTLTFDDGLYSQWSYLAEFEKIPTDKIFFISTGFLCNGQQSSHFPKSHIAHDKARAGVLEDFMTANQVIQIANTPNCYIGGHGHVHINLRAIPKLIDRLKAIKADTETMKAEFVKLLGQCPTKFCFPYNENLDELYSGLLRQYGFTELYGRERIAVESLTSLHD